MSNSARRSAARDDVAIRPAAHGSAARDDVAIWPAARGDIPLLFALIRELAEFERAPDAVVGSEQLLEEALFGERPAAEAVIAEADGRAAGFALFFTTFSSWLCRPGLWLEDLYVRPEFRRRGIGEALLRTAARIAGERGCERMEWSALDWNESAHRFYERLGATQLREWMLFRVQGEALAGLAGADRYANGDSLPGPER